MGHASPANMAGFSFQGLFVICLTGVRLTWQMLARNLCEMLVNLLMATTLGASVAKWLAHLPFTSEAAGSSLSENFLNATRTQSPCEKSKSQRSAESRGFPPGTPVSSHRES